MLHNIAVPDQLDPNALELLKSGIMSADDYESMAQRFNDCPTMLRMISKYADDAVEAMSNDPGARNERSRISAIAMNTRNGRSARLQDWDRLCSIARTCAGIRYNGYDYSERMGAYWDEATPAILEEF